MKISASWKTSFSLLLAASLFGACGVEGEEGGTEVQQLASLLTATPVPNPPPTSCNQRHAGVTAIQALVRIDEYQGLIKGRNGTHEIAYGTITATSWVYDSKVVDTTNLQLALNVKSAKDPTGLPHEVKLAVGQIVEVEGELIPSSATSVHDAKGKAGVLHFTHAPCGYIDIGGTVYK